MKTSLIFPATPPSVLDKSLFVELVAMYFGGASNFEPVPKRKSPDEAPASECEYMREEIPIVRAHHDWYWILVWKQDGITSCIWCTEPPLVVATDPGTFHIHRGTKLCHLNWHEAEQTISTGFYTQGLTLEIAALWQRITGIYTWLLRAGYQPRP